MESKDISELNSELNAFIADLLLKDEVSDLMNKGLVSKSDLLRIAEECFELPSVDDFVKKICAHVIAGLRQKNRLSEEKGVCVFPDGSVEIIDRMPEEEDEFLSFMSKIE